MMVIDEIWSRLVSASIDSIIELFVEAIDETEEKLNKLITAPLTAGKGFLQRAEREPQNREYLIVKAQDKFTEMVAFEGHPYLQSRALYFVGLCHKLLGNIHLSNQYFFDACLKAMEAVEEAERKVHGGKFFFDPSGHTANMRGLNESEKEGIIYNTVIARGDRRATWYYPVKDDYMKSLDKIIGEEMPICCVWVDSIGESAVRNNNLIDASKRTFFSKIFGEESPYFQKKETYINNARKILSI